MARRNAKADKTGEHGETAEKKAGIGDEVDSLFTLPLSEFTTARNDLIQRLKQSGRGNEAEKVKALVKPPVSAWAVNQLYWKHQDAFARLLAAGASLGQAHASQLAGNPADVRAPLTAKREAVSMLLQLADKLLHGAGHNSTPDTMRRITATLEALATTPLSISGAPIPGRLTSDVTPLGFESLAALVPAETITTASSRKVAPASAALEAAEQALREVRIHTEEVTAALHEAAALAREREKDREQAEAHLAKTTVAAEEARLRVQELTLQAERLKTALDDSERAVQNARTQLTPPD